ncbi:MULTISPECIES: DUF5984 family protein [Actinoplanes]|uniref:DUF5984 family protein n=1 Tax=Actinoplanes TaxID=1865 RepID=UPI0005F2F76B|nr:MULTISPECIES: DUF5984 family protein [Actinoplanes]GLY03735.1 hypothetical protein Acsp01_41140 [Actinoplanes sp. NBRC 101535]
MLRFEFVLRTLDEVAPWGGDRPTLHWFGLTDGRFGISGDGWRILPDTDYYVVRLWEDVIVLRQVLEEPVPEDLRWFVDGSEPRREWPEGDWSAEVDAAIDLQGDFDLPLHYLERPPAVRFWRHIVDGRDVVTVSQRIGERARDCYEGPPVLEVDVPTAEFFAAVDDFDRRLIAAMDERVAALERSGPPPGVDLDVRQLRREHDERSTWLRQRLSLPRTVDWAAVRAGAAETAAWPVDQD